MKKILIILMLTISLFGYGQPTTWNGTSWSTGVPTSAKNAIISGIYTTSPTTPSFTCRVLTITTGVLTITSGYSVTVRDIAASTSANFIVENNGSINQTSNNANVGSITFKRDTKPSKLSDFTYWCSPVANQDLTLLPPYPTVTPEVFSYTGSGNVYTSFVREYSGIMVSGKGYISAKRIANDISPQTTNTMNFTGIPNNGNISYTSNSTDNLHLTGNPYPSSLDMRNFIITNSTLLEFLFNINTIYLWTHNTVLSSAISGSWTYNYTNDDYATYNLTGGVSASSPIVDGTPNNSTTPTKDIGSGQGFFISTLTNGPRTFNFDNSMRTNGNSQFYRKGEIIENNRIWLYISNGPNVRHNMIGYVTGATNKYDNQYDAIQLDNLYGSIYSILDDKKLSIQGRELPFDDNDIIKLGYKAPVDGEYKIGISDIDGLFTNTNQPIYLEDKYLNIIYNLRDGEYGFKVNSGEVIENRFVLKFRDPILSNLMDTVVYSKNGDLNVSSPEIIKEIIVYNILGQEIYRKTNINSRTFSIEGIPIGIVVVKVKIGESITSNKTKEITKTTYHAIW